MDQIKVAATIWIHSNAETGIPIGWEVFDITGEHIPVDALQYLLDEESILDDLEIFDELEAEEAYLAILIMEFDHSWYVAGIDGYMISPFVDIDALAAAKPETGSIEDVKVHDHALTESEIADLAGDEVFEDDAIWGKEQE